MPYSLILSSCILLLTYAGNAANVKWGDFEVWDVDGGALRYGSVTSKSGWGGCAYIDLEIKESGSGVDLRAYAGYYETCCVWTLAMAGDVLDESYFTGQSEYFYKYGVYSDMTERSDYTVTIDRGDSVYLAALVADYVVRDSDFMYGWLQIGVDEHGKLYALGSALDIDGDPMIVGGGSASVPEPSGGILLLVGASVLVLRRRRQIAVPFRDIASPL